MVRPRPPKRARPVITVRPQPWQEVVNFAREIPRLFWWNSGRLHGIRKDMDLKFQQLMMVDIPRFPRWGLPGHNWWSCHVFSVYLACCEIMHLQVLDPGSSIEETTHAVALVVNDTLEWENLWQVLEDQAQISRYLVSWSRHQPSFAVTEHFRKRN